MQKISIEELAKYSDQYIFISEDGAKILAADKDLKKLHKKIEKIKGR